MADLVAHGGASARAPQNTLEAFELAIKLGAEMIEFDIWRTADGVLVVHHDPDIQGKLIAKHAYETLPLLPGGKQLVTLEQFLKLSWGRVKLDIELKEAGYEQDVMEMALTYFKPDKLLVTSFIDEAVQNVKKHYPHIRTGLIIGRTSNPFKVSLAELFPLSRYKACQADVIVSSYLLANMGVLLQATIKRIPLIVWTVDSSLSHKTLEQIKCVEGVVSNMPDKKAPVIEVPKKVLSLFR